MPFVHLSIISGIVLRVHRHRIVDEMIQRKFPPRVFERLRISTLVYGGIPITSTALA